jgi:hypothetical protein
MKQHHKLLLLICIFFIHSNDSFSPRPVLPATHSSGKYPLFYRYANVAEETTVNKQDSLHHHDSFLSTILREGHSDAAKRIALDAQENVQVYDSLRGEKTKRAWQSLVPLIPGERGFDITVKWSSPEDGSKLLLQHLFLKQQPLLQRQLQESFETFQSLLPSYSQFKARIVSTRGSSGTKCPRYHVDHVPMRWVQALVGPGCDYVVGSDGISWEAINGMEEVESNEAANLELVNESLADIRHAKEGQGVVLMGAKNDAGKFPAVHKSPTLHPLQGRVLLTLDVVRE